MHEHLPRRLWFDDQYAATIGRHHSPRQVLLFMGIRACIDPFELQRVALLAEVWDAQVTVVDAPGYGYGGAKLTPTARHALRHGSFVPVAAQMISDAQRHHPILATAPVSVVGYSMGASLAAATVATGRLDVDTLTLVEPVALRRWPIGTLLNTVRRENSYRKQYLEANVPWPGPVVPPTLQPGRRPSQSWVDLAHYGAGLAHGHLLHDMLSKPEMRCFTMHVIHGRESGLAREDDVERFVADCHGVGITAEDIAIDGRHALWHSLTAVESLARILLARWMNHTGRAVGAGSPAQCCLPPTEPLQTPSDLST